MANETEKRGASDEARRVVRNHEVVACALDTLGASELGDAEQAVLDFIANLEEQLRSSRLDSARLDWLEDAIAEGNGPEFIAAEYVDHHLALPAGFKIGSVGGSNLRAAIDVAKKP